jgi:hypothetical protein
MASKEGDDRGFEFGMGMPPEVARRLLEREGIFPDKYDDMLRRKGVDAENYHSEKTLVVIARDKIPRIYSVVYREVRRGEHDLPGYPERDESEIETPRVEYVRAILKGLKEIEREGE